MATFMDIHKVPGVTADAAADAHAADLRTQVPYGVDYQRYWVDEEAGTLFCLVEAPDAVAAARVHREAHGLEAQSIFRVREGS
jgi:hypothetical protein